MKIFISYRREDSAHVTGRIYDRLVAKYGEDSIFKDVDSIPFGLDFRKHLDNSVKICDIFLAVIGDKWLTVEDDKGNRRLDDETDWVRIEIESALKRDIPVIPLFVRKISNIEKDKLPESLEDLAFRNGISIRSDPDFHNDMNRLIKGIDELITMKAEPESHPQQNLDAEDTEKFLEDHFEELSTQDQKGTKRPSTKSKIPPTTKKVTEDNIVWVNKTGNTATLGITDFAQEKFSDIVYMEYLISEGEQIQKSSKFGLLESILAASELRSPVSGKVVEINETLQDSPEIINNDPFGKAWMIKIEMKDPSEFESI